MPHVDLNDNKKGGGRIVWLVECDNRYLYLARSGYGSKALGEKYKKTKFISAGVSVELFNKLKDQVGYITDLTKGNQATLL